MLGDPIYIENEERVACIFVKDVLKAVMYTRPIRLRRQEIAEEFSNHAGRRLILAECCGGNLADVRGNGARRRSKEDGVGGRHDEFSRPSRQGRAVASFIFGYVLAGVVRAAVLERGL